MTYHQSASAVAGAVLIWRIPRKAEFFVESSRNMNGNLNFGTFFEKPLYKLKTG